MIWDLHCHLSGVTGATPHERIAQLMTYADRMGVERLVFFMGFPWSTDPAPDDFRRQNDQVITALEHWRDRAFGFAYLNPKYPDESLKKLERCVRDGPLLGVKLWVAVKCNDPRLDPIVRRAAWKWRSGNWAPSEYCTAVILADAVSPRNWPKSATPTFRSTRSD